MKILFFGDIYGDSGIKAFEESIDSLKQKYRPNLIVVNGENSANGRGINKSIYTNYMKKGVNVITMGNWTWGNKELLTFIDNSNVIRPANFKNAPGSGYKTININNEKILVINVLGRTFMNANLANPFETVEAIIENEKADYILIDFHAEATSEKVAFGIYFDGKIDAIVGTHTHVQTNDARVLPKGTLYITDVGMTGPLDGVIGVDKDIVISRFLTGYSGGNIVASGKKQVNAVFLDLKAKNIENIKIIDGENNEFNR